MKNNDYVNKSNSNSPFSPPVHCQYFRWRYTPSYFTTADQILQDRVWEEGTVPGSLPCWWDVGWVVASASGLLGHECVHPSAHPTVVLLSASSGACPNPAYLPSRSIASSQACPSRSLLHFLPTSGVTIMTVSAFTARWVSGSSYLLDWRCGACVKKGVGGYFISWRRMKESKKNLSVSQCCRS